MGDRGRCEKGERPLEWKKDVLAISHLNRAGARALASIDATSRRVGFVFTTAESSYTFSAPSSRSDVFYPVDGRVAGRLFTAEAVYFGRSALVAQYVERPIYTDAQYTTAFAR